MKCDVYENEQFLALGQWPRRVVYGFEVRVIKRLPA